MTIQIRTLTEANQFAYALGRLIDNRDGQFTSLGAHYPHAILAVNVSVQPARVLRTYPTLAQALQEYAAYANSDRPRG